MGNYSELNQFEGLQFMPVKANKMPITVGWQKTKKQYDLGRCEAVGLVCGALSGNLEAIDIDVKYDLTGKLFERYKKAIHEADNTILQKLVVQKTSTGGYHFIYRCSKIEGNLKLANRPTTKQEKEETYKLTLKEEKAKGNENAETVATKAAKNDKVRVLIETRGEGGYVVCFPSKGYEIVHGDFYSISEITIEQRETLHNVARMFNQVVEEYRPKVQEHKQQKGLTPFEDYNDRGNVIALLESHGWKIVKQKGHKTIFLRPGQTTSASSGDYDHEKKWFAVFTTSTEFEPQKAYLPYAVYAMLECGGNFSEAARKLYEAGYGDRIEKQKEINQNTPSKVSLIDDDYSFVADETEYDHYLEMAKSGTLPLGKTTGMPSLDKHFLFKEGSFVIINGFDNVGKTSVILFLALLSSIFHNWVWIIYSAENSVGYCMRKLIEFYWNKSIRKMSSKEYEQAKEFAKAHFTFIKSEDEMYNYKDILLMSKKLMKRRKYSSILIDPYNALKIELTNTSKLSTHEYHYEAISEIKQFVKNSGVSFYINTHAVTSASRLTGDDKKRTPAPKKADVEGGQKWANKADDFLTIHRHVQDPDEWMITEIHVRKIKETETGGKVTSFNDPVKIKMLQGGFSFCEVKTEEGYNIEAKSPIEKWHEGSKPKQKLFIEEDYNNDYLTNLNGEDPF